MNPGASAGGKGKRLLWLKDLGLPVPPFFCVTTQYFREWKDRGQLSADSKANLVAELKGLAGQWFAVRSSAEAEDGATHSFAGIFESHLFVERDDVYSKIIECFECTKSQRVTGYLDSKKAADANVELAVVVQCMIDPSSSGVAFSRTPNVDAASSALVLIEGSYGLGEGVVSGLVKVDRYWSDRMGNLVLQEVQHKDRAVRPNFSLASGPLPKGTPVGGTRLVEVEPSEAAKSILNEGQVLRLTQSILLIEKKMGCAVDVEWAFVGEDLHILQARPVTQAFARIHTFIDTNLTESYPGWTSRLTRTFVPEMYTKVFTQTMQLLGYTASRLKEMAPFLQTLLADHHGHLYYHLDSYYPLLGLLPGGSRNLDSWHRMIGGHRNIADHIPLPRPLSSWERFRIGAALLWITLTSGLRSRWFQRQALARIRALNRALDEFRAGEGQAAKAEMNATRLLEFFFREVDRTKNWGFPVLNDVFVMTGLAQVDAILKRHQLNPKLVPSLIKTKTGVESLKPLRELESLIADVEVHECIKQLNQAIKELGASVSVASSWGTLVRGPKKEIVLSALTQFLDRFGERAFEELKLECPTFRQNPKILFELIAWMSPPGAASGAQEKPDSLRDDPLARLPLHSRIWLNFWVRFTQRAVQTREAARLMRGQYYGWVREVALLLGRDLALAYPTLVSSEQEVFCLSFQALQEFSVRKSRSLESLASEISVQKNLPTNTPNPALKYPEFYWSPYRQGIELSPYFVSATLRADTSKPAAAGDNQWKGIGAAEGRIRGKALVIERPLDALSYTDIQERILVTHTTDPAWIFLMSRCKGLVSEKGSLLSHTAIVGRELGIPTVVGVERITKLLKTDDVIELDGSTGTLLRMSCSDLQPPSPPLGNAAINSQAPTQESPAL